jgi:hypothetical protein
MMLAQGWTWREWVALPLADPGGFGVLFVIVVADSVPCLASAAACVCAY